MRARLQTIGGIDPRVVPPASATVKEILPDGRTVYADTEIQVTKRQKVGPDGKPVWKRHPTTGEPFYPIMEKIETRVPVEFVLEKSPMGHVTKNKHFRETPEDARARELREQTAKIQRELGQSMAERGITVEDLLANVQLGAGAGQTAPEANAEDKPSPFDLEK